MEENKSDTVKGIGFYGLLTIVFIVLKLCGVIAWSWLLVLAPLLICTAVKLITCIIILIIFHRYS